MMFVAKSSLDLLYIHLFKDILQCFFFLAFFLLENLWKTPKKKQKTNKPKVREKMLEKKT